jgi:hypothetical protein
MIQSTLESFRLEEGTVDCLLVPLEEIPFPAPRAAIVVRQAHAVHIRLLHRILGMITCTELKLSL